MFMAWLRTVVGALLLMPSVGCTLCCSPFDHCGPLCNGECGSGCCTTARAGGYSSQAAYYEGETYEPRLAPTPAQPRLAPPRETVQEPVEETAPEMESPSDTTMPEQPYDTFDPNAGVPEETETEPETTAPDEFPDVPQGELPAFEDAFPPQGDATTPEESGIPTE